MTFPYRQTFNVAATFCHVNVKSSAEIFRLIQVFFGGMLCKGILGNFSYFLKVNHSSLQSGSKFVWKFLDSQTEDDLLQLIVWSLSPRKTMEEIFPPKAFP